MKCSKCREITEERMFATFRDRKGDIKRRGICKSCRGQYALDNFEYLKKWRKDYNRNNSTKKRENDKERRSAIKLVIDKIKTDNPCIDCGEYFPAVAMDFDHIGPKVKSIAGFVSGAYKLELIMEEIKNCELVCACCHRVRTHERKQNHAPNKHGDLI